MTKLMRTPSKNGPPKSPDPNRVKGSQNNNLDDPGGPETSSNDYAAQAADSI
jgi:hypothetical protein